MGRISREWHEAHKMPRNPSLDDRIRWHISHSKNCACRPIPAKLQQQIDRRLASGPTLQSLADDLLV